MNAHFDLITIGGGSGGVAASRTAARHGAKTALVEKSRLGGTCVMRGCIPKKLLVYASQFRTAFETAGAFGWSAASPQFGMGNWQDAKNAELSRLEAVYHDMLREAGVEIISGTAEILGPNRVRVGQRELSCQRLLIATGSRPSQTAASGLASALTSDDILDLRVVPKRLAIIGAGYIGAEFASMFARLGSEVSLFFRSSLPLRGFDEDLRQRLASALAQAGVRLFPDTAVDTVRRIAGGYALHCANGEQWQFDAVLNATGRRANTENLGLERIGIELTPAGAIPVDEYSQTKISGVYAVGDVTNRVNLTPVAIAEGRAFSDTVFGGLDLPFSHRQVATAVFTDPSLGTVGLSEAEAAARGSVLVYATEFTPLLAAFAKRRERTYMKLIVDAESDEVLGAHMIGPEAPEIIQILAVALKAGVTKKQFDQTIAVHPTAAEEFVLMRQPARQLP